jgi:hypothetical protein
MRDAVRLFRRHLVLGQSDEGYADAADLPNVKIISAR